MKVDLEQYNYGRKDFTQPKFLKEKIIVGVAIAFLIYVLLFTS